MAAIINLVMDSPYYNMSVRLLAPVVIVLMCYYVSSWINGGKVVAPSKEKMDRIKNRPGNKTFRVSKKKEESMFDMFK